MDSLFGQSASDVVPHLFFREYVVVALVAIVLFLLCYFMLNIALNCFSRHY